MKQIAAAFVKAKRGFGPALKDKTNPAFRSKYADLGACLEAVEPALLDNGIALYQETFEDSTGVTVETVLLHESGEVMRCGKLHVPAAKQDPQGYGSALTYCRRYSLMAACGIAAEDDDGNAASKPRQQPESRQHVEPPKPAKDEEHHDYDHAKALAWIDKGKTLAEKEQRARVMYSKAPTATDKAGIQAHIESIQQAELAAA